MCRLAALAGLLVVCAACGDGERQAGPTAPTPQVVVAAPQPAPRTIVGFPPITGPARVFAYRDSPLPRVASYTLVSRFVLYDDGRFALQYSDLGEYAGTYRVSGGDIVFDWEGWSVAGPWGAQAVLDGNVLSVRYNLIMQLTDFEDANYLRAP